MSARPHVPAPVNTSPKWTPLAPAEGLARAERLAWDGLTDPVTTSQLAGYTLSDSVAAGEGHPILSRLMLYVDGNNEPAAFVLVSHCDTCMVLAYSTPEDTREEWAAAVRSYTSGTSLAPLALATAA